MFNQAVIQEEDSKALHISDLYVSTLLKHPDNVVTVILGKLEKNSKFVNEVHLSLL